MFVQYLSTLKFFPHRLTRKVLYSVAWRTMLTRSTVARVSKGPRAQQARRSRSQREAQHTLNPLLQVRVLADLDVFEPLRVRGLVKVRRDGFGCKWEGNEDGLVIVQYLGLLLLAQLRQLLLKPVLVGYDHGRDVDAGADTAESEPEENVSRSKTRSAGRSARTGLSCREKQRT